MKALACICLLSLTFRLGDESPICHEITKDGGCKDYGYSDHNRFSYSQFQIGKGFTEAGGNDNDNDNDDEIDFNYKEIPKLLRSRLPDVCEKPTLAYKTARISFKVGLRPPYLLIV